MDDAVYAELGRQALACTPAHMTNSARINFGKLLATIVANSTLGRNPDRALGLRQELITAHLETPGERGRVTDFLSQAANGVNGAESLVLLGFTLGQNAGAMH